MTQLAPVNFTSQHDILVTVDGDRLVTDSRTVARVFGKEHKNVLQAYDNLRCSPEFSRLNFQPSDFVDHRGKTQRSVRMTKDGFTMLAMGFTGKKAMQFKEAYIAAFNEMAEHMEYGEKNLWQKMQALIAKETASQVKATFGSHLMLARKRELGQLSDERQLLEEAIQPSFPSLLN